MLPTEGGKHIFENGTIDVHHDCDEVEIRENQKCAPHSSGNHFFGGGMFDLRFQCDFMKNGENRKCAPRQGGKHFFCKFNNCIKRARKQELNIFPTDF